MVGKTVQLDQIQAEEIRTADLADAADGFLKSIRMIRGQPAKSGGTCARRRVRDPPLGRRTKRVSI
jgi:hypothetical protein